MPNNAKINVIGNLTKDPVTRAAGANNVVSFSVAVNTPKRNPDNTYKSNFYEVTVWGKQGEYLMQRLQKGSQVWVSGDFYQDEFLGKDNQNHVSLKIDNADVRGLARLKDSAGAAPADSAPAPSPDNEMPF